MKKSIASENIQWQHSGVTLAHREERNSHKGCVIWLTGLPGSGKSTLAQALESLLFDRGCSTFTLDGDNVRHGLCRDLGFSPADRTENIRRVGEVARLFADAGIITLVAFVSPYVSDRVEARNTIGKNRFLEVYCACPLEVCEMRDPKGHYLQARAGIIPAFTGISAPYEAPPMPDLKLDTHMEQPQASANRIMALLLGRSILSAKPISSPIE
jgi:adenylylsulfate kinase